MVYRRCVVLEECWDIVLSRLDRLCASLRTRCLRDRRLCSMGCRLPLGRFAISSCAGLSVLEARQLDVRRAWMVLRDAASC